MADYQTNLSEFADQTSADNEWPTTDTSQARVDITNDVIDFVSILDNTKDSIAKDLQDSNALGSGNNASNTAWVWRFKNDIISLSDGSNNTSKIIWVLLSDSDENSGQNDSQDAIGFAMRLTQSLNDLQAWTKDNSVFTGVADATFSRGLQVETLYVEIIRLSSTSASVELFSDSAYSTSLEKQTITVASTCQSLRYIKMFNRDSATDSGNITVEFDNIQFVDGETEFPQFARPDGDQTVGNWEDEGGATTNLYQSIDEEYPDESDYIQSDDNPSTSSCQVTLANVTDPSSSDGHKVRYLYAKDNYNRTIDLIVRLKQGATTIASQTKSGITTTVTKGEFTLSGAEADNITDYTDLRIEFESNAP